MLKYLTCLRPLNLLIVYLTQVFIYYLFFTPFRGTIKYDWNLYPPTIIFFALVTVSIAASGYLINDYFDHESDELNSKRNKLPRFHNLYYYFFIVLIGFCMALGIALHIGKPLLTLIYLVAVTLLFLYSAIWKKRVLIGNLVVALFSAFVVVILLYAELDHLQNMPNESAATKIIPLTAFSIFAFLISMMREIIKDIEDHEGDKAAGYLTLPIVYGTLRAQRVAAFFGLSLVASLFIWIKYFMISLPLWLPILVMAFLIFPIGYILLKLFSKSELNAALLSKLSKAIMIFGLIFLIITQWKPFLIN